MRKILLLSLLLFFLIINLTLKAQFTIFAGNDTTISCLQPCLNLKARLPDIRSTESYQVISIPYAPYPFVTAAPLYVLPCTGDQDDKYGDIATLPFDFCFFGSTYKSYVLGTNGVFSFDLSNALTGNNYEVTNPLPFRGSGTPDYACPAPPYPRGTLYPKLSIMGAYSDLFPDPADPAYKIEARVEGTAPYRRFVMSYSNVKLYGCQNLKATFEAVLHEGTGLIDIYIKNYPFCAGSNTLIGIQKDGLPGGDFASPPGRNLFSQQITNEAWRFVPSGNASLLDSVVLYKNGVRVISDPAPVVLGNGELEATFSVCQSEDSMSYVIRAFYQQCDNPAIETEGSDTIIVYKTLTPTATATNARCNGADGTITVDTPTGSNLEYSIDGGITWQASNIFTKPAGTYTIIARVVGSMCTGTTTATLTDPPPIPVDGTVAPAACNASATGSITVTTPVGVDYEYSIDGGITWQPSPVFNNLPAGNYTITINQISINCKNSKPFSITEPPVLSASAAQSNQATCANNDGSITVSANGGTPLYEYSVNNGANWQASNILTGLPVGNYSNIKVRDSKGCISPVNPTAVALNDTMRLELGADTTICFGSSITLIPQTNALTDKFKWTPTATLNDDTLRTPVATPNDTTKYYLTAKWGPCVRNDFITVNVLHKPVPYAGKDTTICFKTGATLYGSASNLSGGINYSWSPAGTLATPNMRVTAALPDTTTLYFLTVTDNYGCNFSVTDSVLVTMNPKLFVFAGNDTNAILNRPHQLMASGGVDYVWSPVGPLNNPFIANPLAILNQDTYFNVWVTDAIGCQAGDTVFIKVYEGPYYYLPNAFTPNGDGLNDIFKPIPVGIRNTDYFRIFNRYGQLMYETRQWMQGWDGTLKGKPAATGAYVWIIKGIDKNGSVVEMKGTFILVR
jgi:gliding motility-associated-like protein